MDYEYYETGELKTEIPLKDGKVHGIVKLYDKSGFLRQEQSWQMGKKRGIFKTYAKSGALIEEFEVFNGKKEGNYFRYDSISGNLSFSANFDDGKIIGEVVSYFKDGRIKKISNYKNDLLNGILKEYYSNGVIKFYGFYRNDTALYHKKWDENGDLIDHYFKIISTIKYHENSKEAVRLEIEHSSFDDPKVGLLIGELDEFSAISDTLDKTDNNGLFVDYVLREEHLNNGYLSGILFEIDAQKGQYQMYKPFKINLNELASQTDSSMLTASPAGARL
jgi:antitoxin component YwqK of YwqJK toxin-antitoxin module